MKSQTKDVLHFLETHKKGITNMEAFDRFGATRLSAIIYELRKQGHQIDTVTEKVKTRYGKKIEIARYKLNAA